LEKIVKSNHEHILVVNAREPLLKRRKRTITPVKIQEEDQNLVESYPVVAAVRHTEDSYVTYVSEKRMY